jgi:PKD repeat protein
MRKLLLVPLLLATALGCQSKTATGPGVVKITETTTTTSIPPPPPTTTIPIPLEAKFTFSPLTPEELQVVNFNGSTSVGGTDMDGQHTVVAWNWDFGDGDPPKTGVRVTHDFVKTGLYLVTLTVTSEQGKTATNSQTITVRPKPPEK